MRFLSCIIIFVCVCIPGIGHTYAYVAQLGGQQTRPVSNQTVGDPVLWPSSNISMVLNFDAEFTARAEEAMEQWNNVNTPLQINTGFGVAQPCNVEGINAAGWRFVTCSGAQFGDALAITIRNYRFNNASGKWETIDADIIFDQTEPWVSRFSGTLPVGVQDFSRVMVHELGHAIGLEHPDDSNQNVPAIMNSTVSDIETLQTDDREGIVFLYGQNGGAATTSVPVNSGGGGGGAIGSGITLLLLVFRLNRILSFKDK